MANHKVVIIVGLVFDCLLFLILIVLFCDINCGGYNTCWGIWTASAAATSIITAIRAFHVLGFMACIGAIVVWGLMLGKVFDTFQGAIAIITLTSIGLLCGIITAGCYTSWDVVPGGGNMSTALLALVWLAVGCALASWICALLIILGCTGGAQGGRPSRESRQQQRHSSKPPPAQPSPIRFSRHQVQAAPQSPPPPERQKTGAAFRDTQSTPASQRRFTAP